jgi:DNA-binding transcriptional MerR regulator/methylmalonyl-CoA mutase cobalamin-binding subunit
MSQFYARSSARDSADRPRPSGLQARTVAVRCLVSYTEQTLFTIKQASKLTGVPEATLRTWERRYSVVTPSRTDAGYRIYGNEAIAAITAMRRLVDSGWSPAEAARAVREGTVPTAVPEPAQVEGASRGPGEDGNAATHMEQFLSSAARMDLGGVEMSLDRGFSLGSFEHVVDAWLFPTLIALGEGWARGEIDVAGEHLASHAVLRRLSAAFDAAGSRSRGPRVVVGLPPGSHHELGALAFATAIRRRGHDVLYLGANVPSTSWEAAVLGHQARAAVLAVVTAADRPSAAATAGTLTALHPELLVASGGALGGHLTRSSHTLPVGIADAARELDALLP